MTKEEYRKTIDEVIYICTCAVNGEVPDKEHTASINLENLYKAADKHNLCAIVGMHWNRQEFLIMRLFRQKQRQYEKKRSWRSTRSFYLSALKRRGYGIFR